MVIMRWKIGIIALFVFCGQAMAQQNFDLLRKYVAYQTDRDIKIDGKAEESAWQEVPFSQDFIDIEGKVKPKYKTQMKMIWDEQYLYIYAKMEEPHVWATLKQKDTVIFYNNDFEVFIDPDNDTHNYYEMEFNALNTLWDLFITKPYREKDGQIAVDWNMSNYKSAIHVDGTLNNSTDIDKGWSIEIALPWSAFRTAYLQDNVPRNKFWRMGYSRVNWEFDLTDGRYSRKKDKNGKFLHEYNWVWSPTGVVNMHEPEMWGYVFFSTAKTGEHIAFEIPEDEKVRLALYQVFKKQKAYQAKNGKAANSLNELGIDSKKIGKDRLVFQFENHLTGWNIRTTSPYSKKTYTIKEDGKIISQ